MNSKLASIQRFLKAARILDPDMSVQRLMALIEVALHEDGIDQSALVKQLAQTRSGASKNVAWWTELTPKKTRGPGLILSEIDPMNQSSRILQLTPKGKNALEMILAGARLT